MSMVDATKEEIVTGRFLFGFVGAANVGVIGWIVSAIKADDDTLLNWAFVLAGILSLTMGILYRQLGRLTEILRRL